MLRRELLTTYHNRLLHARCKKQMAPRPLMKPGIIDAVLNRDQQDGWRQIVGLPTAQLLGTNAMQPKLCNKYNIDQLILCAMTTLQIWLSRCSYHSARHRSLDGRPVVDSSGTGRPCRPLEENGRARARRDLCAAVQGPRRSDGRVVVDATRPRLQCLPLEEDGRAGPGGDLCAAGGEEDVSTAAAGRR